MWIKRLTLVIAALLLLCAVVLPMGARAETNTQSVCKGLELTGGKCGADDPNVPGVDSTIKLVVNLFSLVVGIVAVIMIIVGGFKYVTSQGESSNTAGAKNTILYAIIGLVIVALAQVIVKFVLNKVENKPPKKTAYHVASPTVTKHFPSTLYKSNLETTKVIVV